MISEYQDVAEALKREYGHEYTARGVKHFDFSRHVYVGRAGALLLKADRQMSELTTLRADAVRMRGLLEACGIAMKLHTDSRVPTDWKYMIAAIDAAMAVHKELSA